MVAFIAQLNRLHQLFSATSRNKAYTAFLTAFFRLHHLCIVVDYLIDLIFSYVTRCTILNNLDLLFFIAVVRKVVHVGECTQINIGHDA